MHQMIVLRFQAWETMPLQSVVLDIAHAAFNLPLVPGRARLRGQDHHAVVLAEGLDLGIEVRVVPVRLLDRRLEVVDHQDLRHAAEMPEGVFNAANEIFGGLAIDRLGVSLAAVREHDAKDVRLPPLAIGQLNPCPGTEIDLGLLASFALHAAERQRAGPS